MADNVFINYPPVLGINGCQDTFHDASATLLANGMIAASLEEERFNRIKHSRGVPWMAVESALKSCGVDRTELAGVGFYLDPWLMMRHYFLNPVREFYPESFDLFQALPFYLQFLRFRQIIRKGLSIPSRTPIFYVRHHLCHAAAAYYGSQYERAAVLVVDGSGESETASYYLGEGNQLRPIGAPMRYPTSVGFFYEGVASHLGLGWIGGAGKLMGLAPFGRPNQYHELRSWFDLCNDGSVRIDLSKMSYYLNKEFFTPAGLDVLGPRREPHEPILQEHADLAASAQRVLEDVVVHLAICLRKRTNAESLCYAGGVALNIDANSALLERAGFKNVYIMPAAYDGGTSIGAAYATYFRLFPRAPRPPALDRADYGTAHTDSSIEVAIQDSGLPYVRLGDSELIDVLAKRLAQGAVVGWFRGRMEFGPRALGFRSILADPRDKRMADYLNARVKGRETFRPFAPAVPLDVANKYFEVLAPSPFMLYKFAVRPEYRKNLAAVTHLDGSARAQTVTESENSMFYNLLMRFGEVTGVPILLNTSFNLTGEPLVESPAQAIRSFCAGGMDTLVLNNFVIGGATAPRFASFHGLPEPPPGMIMLGSSPQDEKARVEPKRFDVALSYIERWLNESVQRKSASTFFRRWYRPSLLKLLQIGALLGNVLARHVIRRI